MHWKLEPFSLEEKAKLALVEVVAPEGPESIAVLGGMVSAGGGEDSTVQVRVAGEVSVLAALSVALTEKVWLPTATEPYAFGVVQAPQEPESSLHWKLELLSEAEKVKLALAEVVVPDGPESIVVLGGVVSVGDVVGFSGGVVGGEGGTGGETGGTATGGTGPIGGGGVDEGTLAGSRGFDPAATSVPSPNPSPSVSNL